MVVNWILLFFCVLAATSNGWSQAPKALPGFVDYPVSEIYRGPLVAPKIVTMAQRSYRTRIRQGISKGWGVRGGGMSDSNPGPNFAGKMVVIEWGCGSPCTMMAMVDAETAVVYPPPIAFLGELKLPLLTVGLSVARTVTLQFRLNSRLLIVDATPKQDDEHLSYTHYFLWEGTRWKLLRRVLLK